MDSQVGRMAKTEGSTRICAKVRGGKGLDRWWIGAENRAQRSGEGGWGYEKTEEEEMIRVRPSTVGPRWIG